MKPGLRSIITLALLLPLLAACGAAPRVRVAPTAGAVVATESAPDATSVPATEPDDESDPKIHRVLAGETLYSIAFRQGLDYRELAAINQIPAPYTIYPDQRLRLSSEASGRDSHAVADPAANPADARAGTGTYALADPERPLTAEALPTSPGAVQEVRLSGAGRLISDPPQQGPAPMVAGPKPEPLPPVVVAKPMVPAVAAVDETAATRTVDGIGWRWPAAGKVIGRFLAGDPTQQGIDLAGPVGTPVRAAADGEVVYSGNGLLGYGELLIVQHSPDLLSAYGHNQRRLAQEGERVRAGQVIAEQGQRGSVGLLHFEVRKRGKPVDPLSYLPPR